MAKKTPVAGGIGTLAEEVQKCHHHLVAIEQLLENLVHPMSIEQLREHIASQDSPCACEEE